MEANKELRLQQRLLLLLERRYTRQIRAEISRASVAMIAEFELTGAEPALPLDHERNMRAIFDELISASVQAFGIRVLEQGDGKSMTPLERKGFADFLMRIAAEYILAEATRQVITKITTTTRSQIIEQVRSGYAEGWGISKIARAMSSAVPSISRSRASLIARTETHNAANTGAFQAASQSSLPFDKIWRSVSDDRTRDSHSDMNGIRVPMDQPFEVPRSDGGVDLMMHVGDRSGGSAGNTINCRCGIGFVRPLKQ